LVSAPFVLVLPDGVFGRSDLAALRGCHTLNVCLFVYYILYLPVSRLCFSAVLSAARENAGMCVLYAQHVMTPLEPKPKYVIVWCK
jgi:hypothetical protein